MTHWNQLVGVSTTRTLLWPFACHLMGKYRNPGCSWLPLLTSKGTWGNHKNVPSGHWNAKSHCKGAKESHRKACFAKPRMTRGAPGAKDIEGGDTWISAFFSSKKTLRKNGSIYVSNKKGTSSTQHELHEFYVSFFASAALESIRISSVTAVNASCSPMWLVEIGTAQNVEISWQFWRHLNSNARLHELLPRNKSNLDVGKRHAMVYSPSSNDWLNKLFRPANALPRGKRPGLEDKLPQVEPFLCQRCRVVPRDVLGASVKRERIIFFQRTPFFFKWRVVLVFSGSTSEIKGEGVSFNFSI